MENIESLRNFNYITIVIFSINNNCVILYINVFVIDLDVSLYLVNCIFFSSPFRKTYIMKN